MSNTEKVVSSPDDLVVVGSSAGGIEALSTLVGSLPSNFPAPVVLAQHLDPNRQSNLDVILQHRTSLPVKVVNSRTALEPGKIYVVPSNRYVLIKDHHVDIQEDGKRPRPSIDLLLSTAVQTFGDHLIAVILTGSGSDGAAGAVEVKSAGGTVIIQDPQTALYPSMPMALPPTIVDFEAKVEQIGPLLYNLLTGVSITQTEEKTEDVLRDILEQVSQQASIDFRPYKTSTILRRIGRRMAVTHTHSLRDYARYLKTSPEEVGELVKAFLINVTQFFRDADAFTYLKEEILPKVIANAREHDRVLRFWAAGCATGEEPYSLAMLITDMLGSELPEWSVKIFATDLDESTINFARRGIYSENLLKGLPDHYRERFFERVEQGYRVAKTLRQMVIFGLQDLSRSAPFPHIHLVLCRNVLIYFTPELQDYVLNQFAFSLSPNGYLFLGKAETVRPTQSFYELVNKQWKIYQCVGTALPSIRRQNLPTINTPLLEERTVNRPSRSMNKQSSAQDPVPAVGEIGQLRRYNELLLRFLPIGVVVIDRNYRILTANGAARRLLGLRDISIGQDFLHAVRGIPYATTRNAIDSVFQERNAVTLSEVELEVASGGNGAFVSLSIALMQVEINTPELAAISVSDVTEQVQIRKQLETAQVEQTQLMNELGTANKRLSYVNKELMDANEELQVANEELMLTHEELQASIEEFETTNEELQAANEELETNNEELQAANEELETTNEELRARTNELQELTSILDSERVGLAEIVELAPFYILVLRGPALLVEAYNPGYARLLEGRAAQDRPLEEVAELFWDSQVGTTLTRLAREVYQRDAMRTTSRIPTSVLPTQGESRPGYFVYTLVPSHDASGRVNGVIIYTVDETEQRARDAEEERERLKIIFDNTPSAMLALYDATTADLILASPNYLSTVARARGVPPEHLIGRKWYELTVFSPGEHAALLWNTVLESRKAIRFPEVHYTFAPENQETAWDYSLTPILDNENPETVCFILVSTVEVTEQVQARIELERLDSLKDDFLSLATHELRTPLTSILGNAQILSRNIKKQAANSDGQAPQQSQFEQWISILDKIAYQTNRTNRLIEEMMDVARMRGKVFDLHNKENVDIIEMVQRVTDQQSTIDAGNHEIRFTTNTDVALGTLDADHIEQVLNNLINNALKYSPKGTQLDVTVTCSPDTPGYVNISVQDEGYGIGKEEQEHIFDRFYRAHNHKDVKIDGLGLGLYIALEIVTQQGGKMWLESTLGKGSTFYFTLPTTKSSVHS